LRSGLIRVSASLRRWKAAPARSRFLPQALAPTAGNSFKSSLRSKLLGFGFCSPVGFLLHLAAIYEGSGSGRNSLHMREEPVYEE
jgi:hypothetical protein